VNALSDPPVAITIVVTFYARSTRSWCCAGHAAW